MEKTPATILAILGDKKLTSFMRNIVQMPGRTPPKSQERILHRSLTLPGVLDEPESLSKIQRWLEIGDSALQSETPKKDKPRCA